MRIVRFTAPPGTQPNAAELHTAAMACAHANTLQHPCILSPLMHSLLCAHMPSPTSLPSLALAGAGPGNSANSAQDSAQVPCGVQLVHLAGAAAPSNIANSAQVSCGVQLVHERYNGGTLRSVIDAGGFLACAPFPPLSGPVAVPGAGAGKMVRALSVQKGSGNMSGGVSGRRWTAIWRVLLSVAQGMVHAHSKRVIHGLLMPENILLLVRYYQIRLALQCVL